MKITVIIYIAFYDLMIAEAKWSIGNPCCTRCTTNHTLCRFKPSKFGEKCVRAKLVQINDTLKQEIVHAHNNRRSEWAKKYKASGMHYVNWDENLELTAMRWAMQCIPKSDLCRDKLDTEVGQLIYFQKSLSLDGSNQILHGIDVFFTITQMEVEYALRSKHLFLTTNKRFNQVMLNLTSRVGCGAVHSFNSVGDRVLILVCNYSPKSNINGQIIFKIGPLCQQCPLHTKCDSKVYPGICLGSRRNQTDFMLVGILLLTSLYNTFKSKYN